MKKGDSVHYQIHRNFWLYFAMFAHLFACSGDKNPNILQSREVESGSSSVTPNTLIYEERILPQFSDSLNGLREFRVKADNPDSELDWFFVNTGDFDGLLHSVTQKDDLSGRIGVKPGPVFRPSASNGGTGQIRARYDLFRGPPPPGNWTLYIKFLGNESLITTYYDEPTTSFLSRKQASIGIQCIDDARLDAKYRQAEAWSEYYQPGEPVLISPDQNSDRSPFPSRPFHPGIPFTSPDSKIKAIDLVVKVEPRDVAGCSRVYAVVDRVQ